MSCNINLVYKVFPSFFRHLLLRKTHTNVASVKNTYQIKAKLEKNPFMKNVLLGIVDKDFLSFPEVEFGVLSTDSNPLFESIPSQSVSCLLANDEKSFLSLLKSGLCKYGFPELYGGLPCHSTYLIKEIEKSDISLNISFLLEVQYSFIINNILKYGSDVQKKLYLKDLIRGGVTGAYALHEEYGGSDPASLKTIAVATEECDGSFILNGEKTRISNGKSANFFIVFAQVEEANKLQSSNLLTAFIVDRETPGLIVTDEQNFDSYNMCRIKFDNACLCPDSVLGSVGDGYKIAVNSFESNKFILLITILKVIRKLVSEITVHISKTNRFPISLKELELMQYKLGKLITTVYAIESSIYFLAGLKDNYILDSTFESIILQNIVFSYGLSVVKECISIFGVKAFDSNAYPYKSLFDEISLLSRSITSPEMFKFYISLISLEHTGKILKEEILKSRNPLNYPMFFLKRILDTRRNAKDSPKLDKQLYMQFHPSLKTNVDQLEYAVCRLQFVLQTLIVRHGTECVQRQVDLIRLSDVVTDIFSMFAVLSRASRAYCTGIRHSDQEILAANSWCKETIKRIKRNVSEILGMELMFDDILYLKLAPDILQNKGYFFRNPMEKNIL